MAVGEARVETAAEEDGGLETELSVFLEVIADDRDDARTDENLLLFEVLGCVGEVRP